MQAHLFLTVPHFTEKNVIVEMSKFRCELSEGGTSCGLLDFFPFHLCLSVCDDYREQKHQGITFVLIISSDVPTRTVGLQFGNNKPFDLWQKC